MKSVMSSQQHFAKAPTINNIQRSTFDRSRGYKTTFNADYLVPIFIDEVLPGDSVKVKTTTLTRVLSPLITPIMDNMYVDLHFWYAPTRLAFANFVKLMGEQDSPADSISYVMPSLVIPAAGFTEASIQDYMGIPTKKQSAGTSPINVVPFRLYNLIYNYNYRDQNLQTPATFRTTDAGDAWTDFALLKRGKRYDYFTSSLPNPQKGATAVSLPLGTSAPVYGTGKTLGLTDGTNSVGLGSSGISNLSAWSGGINTAPGTASGSGTIVGINKNVGVVTSGVSGLYADLSTATSATINAIRTAVTMQQFLERDARGGTRYIELVPSHFGVTVPDFRLSKPEFLGGGTVRMGTQQVAQTAPAAGASAAAGNLTAYGVASHHGVGFSKSFVEHGYIIGLISARADLNYQQGLNKLWSRSDRYDFYWPTFAHLGEQPVYNREIYMQDTSADDSVFGYQEYAADYRYAQNVITGQLRANATTPLTMWHLVQNFGALPTLGSTFIESTTPTAQIKAVTTVPDFVLDCYFESPWARPIPTYSVPGLRSF